MSSEKVAVFGLGFVGLPLALSFAMRGCDVYGVDVNEGLVEDINVGVTYHKEAYRGEDIRAILARELKEGRFRATCSPAEALGRCDNIIITVGMPVSDEGEVFAGHLEDCVCSVASGLKRGDLVVVRSTLVPGMTREFILPILESESGLRAGSDFDLAYSSERIAEGKAFEEFETMPGLVAGLNRESAERTKRLLSIVTRAEISLASSFEVVETAKVVENVSRDVNIAMVNELARFTRALNVDVAEVIALANTHKRVNLLSPGPGVGGYCIPNALHYLADRARRMDVSLPLMHTARRVNEEMPSYMVSMVMKNLVVPPREAVIGVIGLAMKDFSSDDRCSPALKIIRIMEESGITVRAFDPAVNSRYHFSVDSQREAFEGAHGMLLLARQEGIDLDGLDRYVALMSAEGTPFIIDPKNILAGKSVGGAKVEKL